MIEIAITGQQIKPEKAQAYVNDPAAGGIVNFIGTVRDSTKGRKVRHLVFEAYEPMAIAELAKIAQGIKERWSALRIYIVHRTGKVEIGEIAVLISIATPHRKAAFKACEYAIDTLKETVPIWKKEIFEDGEIWVSAHP